MTHSVAQGFGKDTSERIPLPATEAMTAEQKAAAEALIAGPRKGVKGPFIPLMQSPELLNRMAIVGEYLRFDSVLPRHINEFVTLIVARETSNQFEWAIHYPLAMQAGVKESLLQDMAAGARPREMSAELADAWNFTTELLQKHGVSDPTYAAAVERWNTQGVIELSSLIGYFVSVCWVMNVARTPAITANEPLTGLPQ